MALVFWYGSNLDVISTQSLLIALITYVALQAVNVFAFEPDISPAKGAANAIIELLDSTLIDTESTGRKLVPLADEMTPGLENVDFTYLTRP